MLVTVTSEITLPVTDAVGGTVTVAVTVSGAAGAEALLATLAHLFFWDVHSWNENPGPEKLIHLVNWWPQAAAQADGKSSKRSSKTTKDCPFFPTAGGRPPSEKTNLKNVLMTMTL